MAGAKEGGDYLVGSYLPKDEWVGESTTTLLLALG
jgi:hypothetical protein